MHHRIPMLLAALALIFSLASCDWMKGKTKKAINRTGEVAAKAGSEFGEGVYKGVAKTFTNELDVAPALLDAGLEFGEVTVGAGESGNDNKLTLYTIFQQDVDQDLRVKLINEAGKEYGRATGHVQGEKGHAEHIDFTFDPRVDIKLKGTIRVGVE